jgi:hypothetical protein
MTGRMRARRMSLVVALLHGHSAMEATVTIRTILSILCVALGLGLTELASAEPLPEGNSGIALRYPGDVGIGSDPAVIFADDFESYSSAVALTTRWDTIHHFANIRIANETGNFYSGANALEFSVPKQSAEVSNSAIKYVRPERDLVFLRYYAKFDTRFDVLGSSHNGSTISASYCCPGVRADGYNKFLVSYDRPTRAVACAARRGLPDPATLGCGGG